MRLGRFTVNNITHVWQTINIIWQFAYRRDKLAHQQCQLPSFSRTMWKNASQRVLPVAAWGSEVKAEWKVWWLLVFTGGCLWYVACCRHPSCGVIHSETLLSVVNKIFRQDAGYSATIQNIEQMVTTDCTFISSQSESSIHPDHATVRDELHVLIASETYI